MPELKTWEVGCADDPWKIEICENEIRNVDMLLQRLHYILISDISAPKSSQEIMDQLKHLTCQEMLNGVCAYRNSLTQSIKNGEAAKIRKVA